MLCRVLFHWDSEAKVWTATSEDVPGLVLESPSFDRLVSRVKVAIPELLELNGNAQREYRVTIQAQREDVVPAYG